MKKTGGGGLGATWTLQPLTWLVEGQKNEQQNTTPIDIPKK